MTFTNTLVKLVLVSFALYAPLVTIVSVFDGLYAVFGFGQIFLRFCMIFFFGFAVSNIPQCPPHVEISLENLNTGGYWGFKGEWKTGSFLVLWMSAIAK